MSDFGFQTQMGLEAKSLEHRAQAELTAFLEEQPFDFMFTSTFKYPATHASLAIDRTKRSLLSIGSPSVGFVAAEQHKSGLWHTHGLWSYKKRDIGLVKISPGKNGISLSLGRLGFCCVSNVQHRELASRYCAKYLTKDEGVEYEFFGKNWL